MHVCVDGLFQPVCVCVFPTKTKQPVRVVVGCFQPVGAIKPHAQMVQLVEHMVDRGDFVLGGAFTLRDESLPCIVRLANFSSWCHV